MIRRLIFTLLAAAVTVGCTVKYSLSGASIPPDAKTFSVAYFPNNAAMVTPMLSSTLTDALVDKFSRSTRLSQVPEGGDFAFEGEIIGYTSATASVSSNDYAIQNRLTITVRVRFTNLVDEKASFNNRTFSAYADFDAMTSLDAVEAQLCEEIVEKLCDDIFNATVANW